MVACSTSIVLLSSRLLRRSAMLRPESTPVLWTAHCRPCLGGGPYPYRVPSTDAADAERYESATLAL